MGYLDQAAILCGGPFWGEAVVLPWLIDYTARHGVPLVTHLRFGHMLPTATIPIGAQGRLETQRWTLFTRPFPT